MPDGNGGLKVNATPGTGRDYGLDNLRFFLIFLVVFAHLLEVCASFPGRDLIYRGIYAFHMPAFLFFFGYNARFSVRRIVFRWIVPYFVFQTLYIVFRNVVLQDGAFLQYVVPYWILWYMLVGVFCQMLLPLFDRLNARGRKCALLLLFMVSLLIGYVDAVGYFLSLSRFFVFAPWFLWGYDLKKSAALGAQDMSRTVRMMAAAAFFLALILTAWIAGKVTDDFLYGAASYGKCGSGVFMRAVVSLISFCWIVFLFVCLKPCAGRKLAFITGIGQHTWPVFLLHGFFVKMMPVYFPGWLNSPWQAWLVTCAILFVLGNRWVDWAVQGVGLMWMAKLFETVLPRCKNRL